MNQKTIVQKAVDKIEKWNQRSAARDIVKGNEKEFTKKIHEQRTNTHKKRRSRS